MIGEAELSTIKKLYPDSELKISKTGNFLNGKFSFSAAYRRDIDQLIINPDNLLGPGIKKINDSFEIKIEFLDSFPDSLPMVWEAGGRIASIMKKYSIKEEATMHINKYARNSICLCPSPARITIFEEGKVDLTSFFNKLVTPYFYGLSYFEQYGIWPWGAYSHGYLGILEFYFEEMQGKPSNREILEATLMALENVNKAILPLITTGGFFKHFEKCPCGSGRIFKECHFVQYQGARILACDYKILKEGFGKIDEII